MALNYVQLRSLQQRLDIANNNVAAQRETLKMTKSRAQAGLVTSMEVEQANSNLQQTLAGIPTLATNLGKTENRLAVLFGQFPATLHDKLNVGAFDVRARPAQPRRRNRRQLPACCNTYAR